MNQSEKDRFGGSYERRKKEKNLDIAASKESNETEQKIDAVATESNNVEKSRKRKRKRNSISKRYLIISNDLLQINNSVPVHTVLY